jgi:uncharacterized protein YbjT (DUF2867 family)
LPDTDIVTGAFSYSGRFIAQQLLARGRSVRTLSRMPAPAGSRITAFPLQFADVDALEEALRGSDVLYNTYWIRFERGPSTFARAVENTRLLLRAAARVGVRRVVHLSVSRADESSPFPYFRGKAHTEQAVESSGLSYAIVRPTWVYGRNDILVNNLAWLLRRLPFFLVPSGSGYRVQPISVEEVAELAVEAGERSGDESFDAAGPEERQFGDVVRLVRAAVGSRALLMPAPPAAVLALSRVFDVFARDVLITRHELAGLRASLLTSDEPPRGTASFEAWIRGNGNELGRAYVSELARNFRGHAPL